MIKNILKKIFPKTVNTIEDDAVDNWLFNRFYKKNKGNIGVLDTDEGIYKITVKFTK